MNKIVIVDPDLIKFVKQISRQEKKSFQIKIPWFGKFRGKVIIPSHWLPLLTLLYMQWDYQGRTKNKLNLNLVGQKFSRKINLSKP